MLFRNILVEEPIKVEEIEDIDENSRECKVMYSERYKKKYITEEQCREIYGCSLERMIKFIKEVEGNKVKKWKGYIKDINRTFYMIEK